MYCKICGEQLSESSLICQTCGAKVPSEEKSEKPEIVFNSSSDDFGFSSKPKEKSEETEFHWNVHDFSKPVRNEEPLEFVWDDKAEKFELPKSETLEEKKMESETEIDKFFTLNKKSEDFQKLLDKEFEKLSINKPNYEAEAKLAKQSNRVGETKIEDGENIPKTDNFLLQNTMPVRKIEEPTIRTNDLAEKIDAAFAGSAETFETKSKGNNAQSSFKQSSSYKPSQTDKRSEINFPISPPDRKPRNKGRIVLFIILAIIAVIVVVEAGILSIKYFLPDSGAAASIIAFQGNLSEGINNIFGGKTDDAVKPPDNGNTNPDGTGDGTTNPDGTNGDGTGSTIVTPDPIPMADKSALVATQLSNNVNIKEIKYNETFKFFPNVTYKDPDIATSIPISNNVWFIDKDTKPVYMDQSVVGTIVKFDSLWIDYVNSGKEDAIALTKEDTKARENVLGFKRNSDLTEEFQLLEIGEIRQTTNYLYVWTHERIKVTEDNVSVTKDYKWLYQLEPVENELKIVNYFRY
ncbi:MAG: hypothetical protein WCF96_03100 [Eubacteriales bacterium]